jgi:hypothetical protein
VDHVPGCDLNDTLSPKPQFTQPTGPAKAPSVILRVATWERRLVVKAAWNDGHRFLGRVALASETADASRCHLDHPEPQSRKGFNYRSTGSWLAVWLPDLVSIAKLRSLSAGLNSLLPWVTAPLERLTSVPRGLCAQRAFTGHVTTVLAAAGGCAQGHGITVILSSVAAVRPRKANFVYGATKPGWTPSAGASLTRCTAAACGWYLSGPVSSPAG